ncbi:argininosuccinate synthase [Curtobacterium oceanosedimentum]|uniref:argininosuccinate synthase n=1 Tax=Curtobacterium oceanosedimentum TaxID=465820 RepID=UPI001CE064BE|nr:argininosuccinate synthase [Curtobacterium oceanosedimentum]MCA5924869.1 argininosuccinate synthase [Curtobacterium oceanosedimentum]
MADRVVLASSGGLETSVGIGWLRDATGKDVVALAVDVGQGDDLDVVRQRALDCGAVESLVVDAKDEFADEYVVPALRANALHQKRYPLVSALSRPLIAKHLALTAKQLGADSVAHGCTGVGNDQVRFAAAVAAIAPDLRTLAPVRDPGLHRDRAIASAQERGLPVPHVESSHHSVDQNLWGRSVQSASLEDPWSAPAEALYASTHDPAVPQQADEVTITFDRGVPVALDGQRFSVLRLVQELDAVAGKHGVGRIDVVEDRLTGTKSREVYEAPAAIALITAHEELESLTLERDVLRYKRGVEAEWAGLVYDGLWFGGLKRGLDAFLEHTQQHVSGDVRLRLQGGRATVTGRRSEQSLYDFDLATSEAGDEPDRSPARGFTELWSLPGRITARRDAAN